MSAHVPRANVSGTTRRSVKKSRGGCKRCKSQHLKCGEEKPQCSRCVRLGVECPGYPPQSLKWSTKHEVGRPQSSVQNSTSPPGSSRESGFPLAATPPSIAPDLDWTQLLFQPSMDGIVPEHADPPIFASDTSWDALQPAGGFTPWQISVPASPQSMALQKANERPTIQRRQQTMLQALQGRIVERQPRLQASLTHQSSELISYYFKEVPGVYSMYDSQKNPFRSAVSNLFSHSQVVNLAAQSMAAGFLVDVHPRFATIGRKLRQEALELINNEPNNTNYNAMLALSMFGPTGNWIEASDLGIPFYEMMKTRVNAVRSSGLLRDESYQFFDEALTFWEMNLAFVVDDDVIRPSPSPMEPRTLMPSRKRSAHPWTGVAGEVIQLVSDIGRLVRAHRIRMRKQKFVSQACLDQLNRDLLIARDLERRILSYQSPDDGSIVDLEDDSTSIQHLTTLAEVYRYAGILQLYRVFPDLLADRLAAEDAASQWPVTSQTDLSPTDRSETWLSAFAIEALRLLETVPLESGTRDFQPFLIVLCASELSCGGGNVTRAPSTADEGMSAAFLENILIRKFVLDRLTGCLRLLPPKPIKVCIDIVKETWRRIDAGQKGVYWLDVMIEKRWETIMA